MKKIFKTMIVSVVMMTFAATLAFAGQWKKDTRGWWYQNDNGTYPKNEWRSVNGAWYCFDGAGYMLHDTWSGDYYLGADGAMLTNTTTPDGYRVGADGKWDGSAKTGSASNVEAMWNQDLQRTWEAHVGHILFFQDELLPSFISRGTLNWQPAEHGVYDRTADLIEVLFSKRNPYSGYFVRSVQYGLYMCSGKAETVQAALDYFGVDLRDYPKTQFQNDEEYYYSQLGDFGADIPAAKTQKVSFSGDEVIITGLCAIQSDEDLYERYDHTYTLKLKYNPGGVYTKFRLKSLVIAPY